MDSRKFTKKTPIQYLQPCVVDYWTRLQIDGYVLLKKEISESLCTEVMNQIKKEFALYEGQQQPYEEYSYELKSNMDKIKEHVLTDVFKNKLKLNAVIPDTDDWTETFYARYKKQNNFTEPHCDAFNTIVQRKLLKDVTFPFKNANQLDGMRKMPIYTFWIPLHDTTIKQSHLRIHPGSHRLPLYENTGTSIRPKDYVHNFIGISDKYDAGDVLIFHCLTWHEGSDHSPSEKSPRISIDGRVLIQL